MICEFLPRKYKELLIEIADADDLINAGYGKRSVYMIKKAKVISDERCEKLINVLGERAVPVLKEAFDEFYNELKERGMLL
ncbi:hypothetical protein [Saccharolobus islandicus]|uniref:hypothetical protein n=1 Tax=Saccharolobus islandicus TaxID=43080 RepID=UPI000377F0B8|nr:hypothetical protein [Sulfolobus islandicus]